MASYWQRHSTNVKKLANYLELVSAKHFTHTCTWLYYSFSHTKLINDNLICSHEWCIRDWWNVSFIGSKQRKKMFVHKSLKMAWSAKPQSIFKWFSAFDIVVTSIDWFFFSFHQPHNQPAGWNIKITPSRIRNIKWMEKPALYAVNNIRSEPQ